ncbi:MAG: bifunctional oligoribonuclease/PAP phosphatase NrnA [Roseburia sp.]|nr:bifunctional oligoribonuclease/PAP phosphatase NrnA [Roseburia sp.]
MNTTAINEIIGAIKNSNAVLICGHIRPDGDCISSALAVRHFCRALGKRADAVCDAEKSPSFAFMPEYEDFCNTSCDKYDLFIAVDCANEKRLGAYRRQLEDAANSINIDHHPTNGKFGAINYIDPTAASTCSILYELFSAVGAIDKTMAQMLYVGISTDTGHFMHSNTDSRVFESAAKLCGYGIDVGELNHSIYCNKSLGRIKLMARAIGGLRMYADGKIALMCISLDDLSECGCKSEDTEGLIDTATSIGGVQIAITMCEQEGGLFRVSFRSSHADVAAVAEQFGGGGHKLASGCIVNGDRYDVAARLTDAAAYALRGL